jgi:hypothetical protein
MDSAVFSKLIVQHCILLFPKQSLVRAGNVVELWVPVATARQPLAIKAAAQPVHAAFTPCTKLVVNRCVHLSMWRHSRCCDVWISWAMSCDALVLETQRCFVEAAKDRVKHNAWLAATASQSGFQTLFAAVLLVEHQLNGSITMHRPLLLTPTPSSQSGTCSGCIGCPVMLLLQPLLCDCDFSFFFFLILNTRTVSSLRSRCGGAAHFCNMRRPSLANLFWWLCPYRPFGCTTQTGTCQLGE